MAELEKKAKAGSARLLSIPEDLLGDATSALQEIKAERNAVSQELSRLGVSKGHARQNDASVSGYLEAVRLLARKLVKGDSAKLNAGLREVGIRVLVKQNKSGVESVAIAFQPPEALVPIVNPMPFP